jgi:hypothetical protein
VIILQALKKEKKFEPAILSEQPGDKSLDAGSY